jgi:hypothetical protein
MKTVFVIVLRIVVRLLYFLKRTDRRVRFRVNLSRGLEAAKIVYRNLHNRDFEWLAKIGRTVPRAAINGVTFGDRRTRSVAVPISYSVDP